MGRGIKGEGDNFALASPESPVPAGLVLRPWIAATYPKTASVAAPLASPTPPTSKSSSPDPSYSPGDIQLTVRSRARLDTCSYQGEISFRPSPPTLAIGRSLPSTPADSNRSRRPGVFSAQPTLLLRWG